MVSSDRTQGIRLGTNSDGGGGVRQELWCQSHYLLPLVKYSKETRFEKFPMGGLSVVFDHESFQDLLGGGRERYRGRESREE